MRAFFALIRWDLVIELRRPVSTLNMTIFSLLLLFVGSYAVSTKTEIHEVFGPVYFWTVVLFAGTIGLSRAFAVDRENAAISGILVAPVEAGVCYLAKVVSTWLYVMVMELLLFAAYAVFFDFNHWKGVGALLAIMASFTLTYVALGVVLSAISSNIRAGEVVLRILIVPLMIPALVVVLVSQEGTFWHRPDGSANLAPSLCAVALLAMGAIYLTSGYLLFPKVVEE